MPHDLVSAQVAADILGVHRVTFYRSLRHRLTPHQIDGGPVAYSRSETLNLKRALADEKAMNDGTEAA